MVHMGYIARDENFFVGEKIVSLRKCGEPCFTYTDFPCYVSQTFNVIKTSRIDQLYLTGFFNSRIVRFWLRHKGKMQGHNFQIDKEPLLAIPIFAPSPADQKRVADLVKRIIECHSKIAKAKTSSELDQFSRLASQWDSEIQATIEAHYDLSKEEVKMLSGQVADEGMAS